MAKKIRIRNNLKTERTDVAVGLKQKKKVKLCRTPYRGGPVFLIFLQHQKIFMRNFYAAYVGLLFVKK
jgi:hypothetical protein